MNYNRKQWERTHKKNPIAKELREPKFRPIVIQPKKPKTKLNPRNLEILVDDE